MQLQDVFQKRINILALLCFLAITIITFFKSALELEDAEQAYYSQWLRWGYDDQPPLYTWVQYVVNAVFGISKISYSVLRGVIFSGVLVVLYKFAKGLFKEEKKSQLTVFALVLIPVFIDFTFRRLSHTSLLCLAIITSYWIIQKLILKKSALNYIFLGLIVAIGILSKYNYVLFLGAFALSAFFDSYLRQVIFNKYMLITVFLAMTIVLPHFYWLVGEEGYLVELQTSIQLKIENKTENAIFLVSSATSLVLNLIRLIAPLFIVLAIGLLFKKIQLKKIKRDWFYKLMFAQLTILLLFFVILNIQKVEERWLLPLLLPFLVLVLKAMRFTANKKWVKSSFIIFLFVIGIQIIRTPVEKLFGIPSSVHFGFEPISNKLNKNYKDKQWILPNVTYGGNIKLLNPKKEVFTTDDFSLPKSKLHQINAVEVVLEKDQLNNRLVLDSIIGFGKEKANLYFVSY